MATLARFVGSASQFGGALAGREGVRFSSHITFVESGRKVDNITSRAAADENVFFRKEDEARLQNLLANHPEYNPKFNLTQMEKDGSDWARDLNTVLLKHGVRDTSLALLRDIMAVSKPHTSK